MPATGSPQPRLSESAVRAAGDVWVTVSRLRRRLKALAVEGDLTPAQASVLAHLDKGGPASASDLATLERVRPQSMAKIVAGLEDAGIVERRPDPEDGRRQLVMLTPYGRERRKGDRRAREDWLARALDEQLTEQQRQTVIEALALLDGLVDPADSTGGLGA